MRDGLTAIICDDHPLFRSGVVLCLAEIQDLKVVAQASDVPSAIAKLQIYQPDILITDLSMPGESGFVLLEWIHDHVPDIRVFVLTMHTELAFVEKAKNFGVDGYLAKEDAELELVQAISRPSGEFYTSESIGRQNYNLRLEVPSEDFRTTLKKVSTAEMKVLVELSKSKTSREIAETLNLSPRTVEAHRFNLSEKLNAKGPNKLFEIAIQFRDHIQGFQ